MPYGTDESIPGWRKRKPFVRLVERSCFSLRAKTLRTLSHLLLLGCLANRQFKSGTLGDAPMLCQFQQEFFAF
jgi:hypothetical protein